MKKKKQFKTERKENNSNHSFSSKLKKIIHDGGVVTYFFKEERLRFSKEHPLGEVYYKISMLKKPFNHHIMLNIRGERRSPLEIQEVLETTRQDLGADYFTLE